MITPLKMWIYGLEKMHPSEKAVLQALADHANSAFVAWPSNTRLQKWTSLSERAIRNAIRSLEARKLIVTSEEEGIGLRYLIQFQKQNTPATVAGRFRDEPGQMMPGYYGNGDAESPANIASPPAFSASPPAANAPELGTTGEDKEVPSLDLSPSLGKPARAKPRSRNAEPDGFAEWYDLYPRHQDRQGAAKAFPEACRKVGGVDALMELTRAHRFNSDPKFIPYPATWLRGARWQDQPPPDDPGGGDKVVRPQFGSSNRTRSSAPYTPGEHLADAVKDLWECSA